MAEVRSLPPHPRYGRPTPLETPEAEEPYYPSTTGRTSKGPASSSTSGASKRISPQVSPRCPLKSPKKQSPPSVAELGKALIVLDTDRDGKIWETDLDTAVNLSFRANISSSASESPSGASRKWAEMKEPFVGLDGMVKLAPFISALKTGDLFSDLSGLAEQAPIVTGSLGPFGGILQYVGMFEVFDTDKNGIICARDLAKALARMKGKEVSLEESKELIGKVEPTKKVVDLAGFGALASLLLRGSGMSAVCEEEDEDECCIE